MQLRFAAEPLPEAAGAAAAPAQQTHAVN
jgi:hypothetical protein